ncbi:MULTISPECIES: copper homeostasis periplasmic binding protein CopC [unclassified Sinorhizobium]|uniref:copper homeostasis periplasmic binding protein CopC n=1 Tax=unclassified Sinorhizobium TaxID=2613772 RepID=UPI00352320B4
MKFAAPLSLVAALSYLLAGPAMAHAHLEAATPAANATVSVSPSSLELTFSEGLNLAFSGVDVTNAKGVTIATDKATLGGTDGTVLTVPIHSALQPGVYTVNWHVLSNDGHKTQGSYSFTVKP